MEERVRRSLRVVATAEEKLEQLRREKESVRFAAESSLSFFCCLCVCSWSHSCRGLRDMEVVSLDTANRPR